MAMPQAASPDPVGCGVRRSSIGPLFRTGAATVIHEHDLDFHRPDPVPHDWAGTGYVNVYVPERNLFCWIYVVHRAGVGVTVSDVEIIDGWSSSVDDALYIDYSNHNPLPANARAFTLPSGLSFRASSLRDYLLEYEIAGVSFCLDFTSLMPPYDIHDPTMDPMATEDPKLAIANSGFGRPTLRTSTCRCTPAAS